MNCDPDKYCLKYRSDQELYQYHAGIAQQVEQLTCNQ